MKSPGEHPSLNLAAPGAGLPFVEMVVVRMAFRAFRWTKPPRETGLLFREEQARILELAGLCDPEKGSKRVLIERMMGLEDSSRHWSVFMTLEHLRIVNSSVASVVQMLGSGKVPPGVVTTAAVKPSAGVGPEVIEFFEESCEDFLETTGSGKPTALRYRHPWFGPLDARGWQAMAAIHMRLHRGQVEKILQNLPRRAIS